LNFSGYSDMQNVLRSILKVQMNPPYTPLLNNKTVDNNLLNTVYKNDVSNIKQTVINISQKDIEKTIKMTIEAENVYILGLRASYSLAFLFSNGLQQLTGKAKLIDLGKGDLVEQLTMIGEK